jgi:tRNA nucleotidyltransferase (CCA-adding enzyme)
MEDNNIKEIANKIKNAGGNLYLVGGAVRDKILQKEVFDEDYCVTGISSKEFERLFPNAHIRGKSFPVYCLDQKEFALARKERKITAGHKGFEFETDKNITIQEDLARRDITINSIAEDVLTGKIIDPFNGIEDIKSKIIKKTTDAFKEDPLRVYRVARFAATLEFNVEKNTLIAMNSLKEELKTLSSERVFCEFRKALSANKPSIFFNVLREAGVLEVHFKEIYDLIGKTQPIEYHPEGDAYNHTMIVIDNSSKLTDDLEIRFSCLVHDLGKGTTPEDILPHHYGHDERGGKLVKDLGNRISIPSNWTKCGKTSCKLHMKAGIFEKMTEPKQLDLIEEASKSVLGLDGLKIVVMCDKERNGIFPNVNFDKIGKQMLKNITGDFIKTKYKIEDGIQIKNRLREERIKYLKNVKNSCNM